MSRAAALVIVFLFSPWAALVGADSASHVGGFYHDLPSSRAAAAAVWADGAGYVFGGALASDYATMRLSGYLDEIVLHEPARGETTVVARLPSPRAGASAVWTGEVAYVFGGLGPAGPLDEIVRFDPRDRSVVVMPQRLPVARFYASAVWAEGEAYVFGGIHRVAGADASLADVLRYRPGTGEVAEMGARLDREQAAQAAVWVDGHAYLFGGMRVRSLAWEPTNAVRRYDVANDTLTTVAALDRWTIHASAFWDGSAVRILGGMDPGPGVFPGIVYAFDPIASSLSVVGSGLTRSVMPVVWTGAGRAYGYGGYSAYDVNGAVASILAIAPPGGFADASRNVEAPVVVHVDGRLFAFAMEGDTVRELNLTTRVERVVGARAGLHRAGVASDGTAAYLFGGFDLGRGEVSTAIFRFDPDALTFERRNATLASPRSVHAVWTGVDFLLVPAGDFDDGTPWLHRYDPVADLLTPVASPPLWTDKGAVWADGVLLLWGHGRVTRFDPATGDVSQSAATFRDFGVPGRRGAFWDGTQAYLVGGRGQECDFWNEYCYDVWEPTLRYDPVHDVITTGAVAGHRMDASAVGAGDRAYVVGGWLDGRPGVDVFEYRVAPGRPSLAGSVSPQRVDLSWGAAAHPGSAPIEEYRLYRVGPGVRQLVAASPSPGSYAETELADNATYVYEAVAASAEGEGPAARVTLRTPTLPPGAPVGLYAARGPGAGEISLGWTPPARDGGAAVAGYRVYAGASPDSLGLLAEVATTSFLHEGLAPGATWHYAVRAFNLAGEGAEALASATAPEPASAPTALQARRGSSPDSIEVTWAPPQDDGGLAVFAYRLYGGDAPDALDLLVETSARTFSETGLGFNRVRHYRVSAVSGHWEGALSAVASGATSQPPSSPRFPSVARDGTDALRVTWSAPLETHGLPILHYRVYGGSSETSLGLLGQSESLSFTEGGLSVGALRYYRVSAVTAAGEGEMSVVASGRTASPPSAPRDLRAEPTLPLGNVRLEWLAPDSDGGLPVTGYRVWRSENNGAWQFVGTTADRKFVDSSRMAGQLLRYAVSAVSGAGEGERSAAVSTMGLGVLPG